MPLQPEDQTPPPELSPPGDSVLSVDLRTPSDPPWSGWDVLLIAFVFAMVDITAMFVTIMVVMRSHHVSVEQIAYNARITVPVQLFAYAVALLLMIGLVRSHHRPFWRTVRWRWPDNGLRIASFIVLGAPLAVATTYLETVLPMPKEVPMEKFFSTPGAAYLMALLAVLAAPLMEELFFRGFLYPVTRRVNTVFGIAVTSVAFAVVHGTQYGWSGSAVLLLLIVGLVLTITRERTGSVVHCFLIHVGYNLTLFVMLFISSDHFRHLERVT